MASHRQPEIDYSKLNGRNVIITGGASGLGGQTTIKFATNGAYVTIADLQDNLGKQLAQDLSDQGCRVQYIHCNTTDWSSSANAFRQATRFGPSKTLDVAVLFAGVDGDRTSLIDQVLAADEPSLDEDLPEPKLHRAVDINLIGVYLSTYLALQYFRLKPTDGSTQEFTKSLVLISSMMGYIDGTYNTDYGVSKYGVRGLFRSVRSLAHKMHLRVNNIAPGYVLTPLVKRVHGIERPEQVSKKAGKVLPWTPIEYVVDAVGHCAVNEDTTGRTFSIMPSGFYDINEDAKHGFGADAVDILDRDGLLKALGISLE